MKNSFYGIILTFFFLFGSISSFAQISFGGTPPSFSESKSSEQIDMLTISGPDMQSIMIEDAEDEKNGTMYKVARLVNTDININNSGTWTTLSDGTEIWRLHIKSLGAKGLALHFDRFNIPIGSKLFVYSPDKETVLGSFTSFNNSGNDATSIGLLQGDELIIEYVSPSKTAKYHHPLRSGLSEPDFQLSRISYIYRGMELFGYETRSTDFGASESCQVNVNCSEGANWQTQKKGVAHLYVIEGYFAGFCTGSLVNNTANNGTPYLLTADHCGGTATTSEFNQWIFRFNYEASSCSNPSSSPSANSITGCTKVARGPLNGASDFLLLQLNQTPPASYGVIYNGWNRVNAGSSSGVGIHHPAGDIKKISTYTSSLTSSTYNGQSETGASNAHWRVTWTATANGHGVTEGGSSGSPIFDNNGRIVGTLSGGSSYCTSPNNPDLYGKFYYHWDQYGSSNANKLKPWLDPNNTGATTLDFYDPNNASLNANFTGTPTTVVVGNSVSFTNTSSGNPTSYSWTFTGGSPSSSSSANPTVTYNTVGTYNVSLTVSNGSHSDTETKTGYITVVNQGTPVGFSLDFESCTDFQVDNFDPWTTYDGDQLGTYGSNSFDFTNENYTGSFIAFNPSATNPSSTDSWFTHGGQRCGICFAAAEGQNNDWLISPKITMASNGKIKFWAKSITSQYGLERFKVLVSTTNNSISSFTKISSGTYVEVPTDWTEYEYSLSSYNGQQIYVAIQCVSNDAFAFMIDDIEINAGTQSGSAPVAQFTGSPTTLNAGGTVNFTDQSTNAPTSWSWSFSGGSPSSSSQQNPSITYNTPGTYNVSLTVTNAYGNNNITKTGYITVTQGSSGTGFSLDFESCTDFQVDNFDPWTTYDGDQSGTYAIQNTTFSNQGFTGSFIAFNNSQTNPALSDEWKAHGGERCGICFAASQSANNDWLISPKITMDSNGKIKFWAKSITSQYGLERFKVLVSTTNNNISSFTKISSGNYVEAPTDWTQYEYSLSSYNGQQIYVAIQCVSDNAFAFMIDDIEINAGTQSGSAPVAQFTGSPTTLNAGGTVNFTDQSTNAPTSWSWSFSGGSPSSSSQQNPSITYNTPGTYNVSLTVTNAHGNNSITKNGYITVNQQSGSAPVAQFTGNPTTLNVGGTVNFTDQSTNSPTSWSWTFQGGTPATSTQKNPSVVYNTPGTYNVSLTVTNAHGNNSITKNGYITVTQQGSAPVVDFTASSTWITVGESVNFADVSTNNPTSWTWNLQGGTPSTSNAKNPTVTYNTVGTFNVTLTASNQYGNGTKTKNGLIRVVPPLTSFSLDFEDCSNFQVDNFSPWLTNDVDGLPSLNNTGTEFLNQNYQGSFIAYNHDETNPISGNEYAPHGGDRCGICMPVNGSNNDWLISPQISLGYEGLFSFWAKSVSANGLAEFKVLVNEYSTHPATFVSISGFSSIVVPNEWTLYTYNLNQYREKTVYVAIQCTGSGHYGLMLDDIELISATSIESNIAPNISLYPNPSEGNFVINLGDYSADVDISVTNLNGQIIKIDAYKSGNIINVNMENIANGMYFVRLTSEGFSKTFKINIQK